MSAEKFENVSVICKANVYFDGNVISHTINFKDGSKKTIGLMYNGAYTFNTGAPEKMEIIAGECTVKVKGETLSKVYKAGTAFNVPGNSSYDISITNGITEYICSFE
ncbi:MAG TPA: pyrimidine/purine nucleoside phosphorylase [Chitinispirillaceae bacterium]|nr:pyrimidine/purine nucleoside phosphorylase [Chitinispirillaceae bacterium]